MTLDMETPRESSPPAAASDGVDLSLIRWMLSLTPAERLRVLKEQVEAVLRLRARL